MSRKASWKINLLDCINVDGVLRPPFASSMPQFVKISGKFFFFNGAFVFVGFNWSHIWAVFNSLFLFIDVWFIFFIWVYFDWSRIARGLLVIFKSF